MPRPTSSTSVPRADLAALTQAYMTSQGQFIGLQCLPIFNVSEASGTYPKIPTKALLQLVETKRAPRAAYARSEYEFELNTYDCEENGYEEAVDDVEARLYARYFDAELMASKRAALNLLRSQESRISALLFNATTFSGYTAGVTNEWDDATNATPVNDVNTAKVAIRTNTGIDGPFALVCNWKVRNNLNLSSQIRTRIQYTNPAVGDAVLSDNLIAAALGVDRLIVAGAMYDSANEGQTASPAVMWSDEYALVCRIESGMDLTVPSIGRTFLWTGDSPDNLVVESYREEQTRADIIRCRQYTDEVVIHAAAGYLLSNITT